MDIDAYKARKDRWRFNEEIELPRLKVPLAWKLALAAQTALALALLGAALYVVAHFLAKVW